MIRRGRMANRMMYQPQLRDLMWAYSTLRHIVNGGTLAFPSTKLVYTVDHEHRVLTLLNTSQLSQAESHDVHERSKAVFDLLKYEVLP